MFSETDVTVLPCNPPVPILSCQASHPILNQRHPVRIPQQKGCYPNRIPALAGTRLLLMPDTSVACHRSVLDSHGQLINTLIRRDHPIGVQTSDFTAKRRPVELDKYLIRSIFVGKKPNSQTHVSKKPTTTACDKRGPVNNK